MNPAREPALKTCPRCGRPLVTIDARLRCPGCRLSPNECPCLMVPEPGYFEDGAPTYDDEFSFQEARSE